jgi:hypothetical protein
MHTFFVHMYTTEKNLSTLAHSLFDFFGLFIFFEKPYSKYIQKYYIQYEKVNNNLIPLHCIYGSNFLVQGLGYTI